MRALFIDIGSNSIRTMLAETGPAGPRFSPKTLYTTRLAEGIDGSGALSADRMQRSLSVLRAIAGEAGGTGVPAYAYATSAVRDASNGASFVARAFAEAGVSIDVLSGEEEARLALLGATGGQGALLDIGGGSAQLIWDGGCCSAPCGCVRARDHCPLDRPPADMLDALSPWLARVFQPPARIEGRFAGVGGTITTLAAYDLGLNAYDARAVTDHALSAEAVRRVLTELFLLGEARRAHPLLSARHDVILPGGAVLLYIMQRCGVGSLRVSDADGLEGYAMHILSKGGQR